MKKFRCKTTFKKCIVCGNDFEIERWNIKRVCCSRNCSAVLFSRKRTISLNEFKIQSSEIHKNKYDYSLVTILDYKLPDVKIICPEHGIFIQKFKRHLKGHGCKQCASKNQSMTNQEFILAAKNIHGDKYDYSKVDYIGYNKHVTIICPIHGEFYQTPSQHIGNANKAGCAECAKSIRISKGEASWLDSCKVPNDGAHRQVYINKQSDNSPYFIVDGLSKDGKTIYEYLGDYWHGNPNKYSKNEYNKSCKKTFGELYSETMNRFEELKKLGYNIEYIWESTWKKGK